MKHYYFLTLLIIYFLTLRVRSCADTEKVQYPLPYTDFYPLIPSLSQSSTIVRDSFLPFNLLYSLKHSVKKLEAEFKKYANDHEKNHHHLVLINPSSPRYLYREGITRLNNGSNPIPLTSMYSSEDRDASTKQMMIPTDISFRGDGSSWKFDGYLSGLNSKYETMYHHLEKLFSKSVPLVEEMFASLLSKDEVKLRKKLQAIFSLKSLTLPSTQVKKIAASNWHREGRKNEKIVATIIYYLDLDNISNATLSSRVKRRDGGEYIDFSPITTASNRVVVLPNIYEHRADPFSVDEVGKQGRKRTIVIFLVDPSGHILSTSDIPEPAGDTEMGGYPDFEESDENEETKRFQRSPKDCDYHYTINLF
ncbi:uncharacterized protein LOC118433211 [Folsomia candida]|uniref:DUF4246 domain-containing protein n=1 Tax=Folsomia candida TaxID=158441 RepID=A0A226D1Y2_FOLCA|nr:uncharacterized protein LOC118433211 [Folsomia candida]OXA38727.1 hypothetical protein Fcan01_26546 [Folsomia candida]